MRYSGTWLTPADEAILEYLRLHGSAELEVLHEQSVIDYSKSYLEERCTLLVGRGGFIAFSDDVYRLTDRGKAYLDGELDPAEIAAE